MAKSKRSKIKRSFRAVKRHKAKPKATNLLKKVISLPIGGTGLPYVDASKAESIEPPKIEVVETKTTKKRYPLMNEHGNYPIWMNKKEMRRHIAQRKRVLRKKRKIKV
uniref:DNA-binding protein n=1 Tax=Mesocestoides corti TaxID=53468 RepID=A0A5K3ELD5_MESCO